MQALEQSRAQRLEISLEYWELGMQPAAIFDRKYNKSWYNFWCNIKHCGPPPSLLDPNAGAWTEQSTKTWNISGILGARHAASRKAHSLKDTYFSWPIELPLHFCEHIWVHTMNHFLVCLAIYFEANNV